jgi:hypothetical protein
VSFVYGRIGFICWACVVLLRIVRMYISWFHLIHSVCHDISGLWREEPACFSNFVELG